MSFSLRFSRSHLSEEAASLIAANYRAIASHLISNPDSPLSHLRKIGMSSEDLQKTLSWNHTCPPPVSGLIHEYIARNATSSPNSPAVYASDASLTYRELDKASNILAHFLVRECIGPESVVPLCFGKSAWATVAMLAVVKAGAAFTLLDPSFPTDTLRATIQRTGARLLLCSASCRAIWSGDEGDNDGSPLVIHEVTPESIAALPRPRSIAPPQTSVKPSSLLYVVFTSGSSGEPKGVCVEHSGYLSTSLDFIHATGMDSSSRILQAASYSFDTSIYENLTTLLCGGCVCTPDEETREEKGLAGIIRDFGVNWAYLTPSLVKTIRPDDVLPGLGTLVLMGEAPAEVDIETWAGRVRLINGYGPSECCVASAVRLMRSPDPSDVSPIEAANFGWPVGGLFWVVSPANHHHLVPVGAVGELAIEGPHLGRGYLGDDEQTARAFVDSPEWSSEFPASHSRRIYLTGDIVRRMMDGSVVFLGRKDAQVKVRGMRVELGAVEQHLCADRGVRLAVAVVPEHGARKDRLVAVVSHVSMETTESDVALSAVEFGASQPESELGQLRQSIRGMRDLLRLRLPGYMIPSSWFVLQSFPLRPSGKIDRRNVKEWINAMDTPATDRIECFLDQDEREEITSLAEGLNPITDTIRRQIGLVLNLPFESISPGKSFINLGGDSISALHLKSQCLAENIVLSTHDILRSRSISWLASCAKLADAQVDTILPEDRDSLGVPFDLSPIQQLYFQWEPECTLAGGSNRFNQSFQLRVKRPLSVGDMEQALDLMAERHAILRCRFVQPASPLPGARWRQMIPESTENTFLLREHRISDHEEIDAIILSSQCAIDVFSGPGFVVDLINEPQGQLLSMIAHHAIIDLVSWRIIIRELEVVLQDGVGALRPQRSLSWQVWCRLQADYASRLLSPRVALPRHNRLTPPNLDYWGVENRENKFGNVTRSVVNLDSPTTSLLMGPKLHEALRTEPVDLFLSAVIHSFAEVFYDRQPPIVFRESHGREPWDDSIDISSTVGWFTTMYPILTETNPIKDDLLGTLRRVKDAQRCVPSNGWSYFASRFLHPDGVKAFGSSAPTPEIVFDFLGLYQQLERPDGLFEQEIFFPEEYDIGPEFHRPGLFEITAEIVRGCLRLKFEYNKSMKHQAAIATWVQKCEEGLHAFVSVLAQARHSYTLSDFPLLTTGYDGLDNLFSSILPELGVSLNNVEDVYDTSPMQTGLLLSQAKEPSLYQCFTVFQVAPVSRSHSIDLQRLEEAWIKLIQRHSALRTIFIPDMVSRDGAFCQVVLKMVEPRILKLTCLVSELDAVLREPLSLPVRDALPPHRLTIIDVSDGSRFIRIDINHAFIDGASGDILVRDFISLYHGGEQLPEAPAYRELVSFTQGRDSTKELEYWANVLKHIQPCHLPVLDDGVVQDGSLQVTQAKSLPSLDSLNAFCQSRNITLPTVFKLAWSLVLRAYTGSDNPCFGYLVSGRDDLDADDDRSRIIKENAIGAFVNILACRCDLSDTLDAVLRGIQDDSLRDLQYQYCSLAHVQRNLMLGPGSGRLQQQRQQALFNTILNFQVHQPRVALSEALLALEPVYIHEPTEYNAIIDIHVTSDSLEVALAHWTSSVCPGQAQHLVDAFSAALTSLLHSSSSATITAREMHLVGSGQQKQLWAWNETVPPRVDECIHDIISLNVAAYPAAPAVESWDGSYTYEELEDTTTRLARHLAHLGIGVGSTVPLCFEKSAWAVISMLAVLKAGGSFLLLDPKHVSADRTMGIVKDTQARFVLASKKESMLLNDLVAVLGVMSCPNCLKDDLSETHSSPIHVVTPLDPAYIIFTSATTGQPKGIVTSHSAFCTAAQAQGRRLQLSRSSRMLQYASYSFDASIAEIIMPLFFGGCVCVPSERQRTDGITDMINETQVNFAILTPTVARLVAPADIPGVKALVLCGEPMARLDIAQWKGHVRLMNAYGPSECGVSTAVNNYISADPTNIGHQAGCICWVVDPEDSERLVPIGGVGELMIEGFNLADGYLNNEEKTRQAFVNPPSWLVEQRSKNHGEDAVPTRVYKTGDLIRLNSDGSIKFIGRKDTQSKLHGQRIELHEIEQHMLSHYDALGTLAVEVIEPEIRKGSQTLAAFITLARGKGEEDDGRNGPEKTDIHGENNFLELPQDLTVQFQALQTALASVLSPYMIPTLFIALSAFPLSPSGKLDRRTLRRNAAKIPATLFRQYSLAGGAIQERLESEAEETLRKAWVETLGVQPDMIGRKTSFTRLGGDSLAAMRLASIARSKYGLAIAVADIFKRPRLCDMASEMGVYDLGSGAISSHPADIKPFALLDLGDKSVDWLISTAAIQCRIAPDDILDMYPCTPLQEGLMAISVEKQGAYLHRGVFPLPRKTVDLNRLKRAWEVVVAANPILRTRFVSIEGTSNMQVVLNQSITWLHPVACSKEKYLADDLDIALAWGSPLNRFAVLEPADNADDDEEPCLVWTAHHGLFDEWSLNLTLEQLQKAYRQEELPTVLPFNHFIAHISSKDEAACATYWASQLAGDTPPATIPQLPTNTYVPRISGSHSRLISVTRSRSAGAHITTPTILRAAWALVTGRYANTANAEHVIFGASVSGRSAAVDGVERINGPTLATVPVKVYLGREQPISGFLEDIQAQAADMIQYEHWGLHNMAGVSRNVAFQNLFVVHLPDGRSSSSTKSDGMGWNEPPDGLKMIASTHADYHVYALVAECFLQEDNQSFTIRMSYDGQVVPYAARLASHFDWLVQQLIDRAEDESPLGTLDFCSAEDKLRIREWNHEDPKIVEDCIHEIVSMNATQRPNAPAIRAWDFDLTYAQLDAMSAKLARHLVHGMGVRVEQIVPVIFEKSAWAVMAQLAVLKAGGVMCMLDPAHPPQRLEDQIDITEAHFILASELYSDLLRRDGRTILTIDASTMQSISEGVEEALPIVKPENAAYVVFTSGTTGRPKASITEHRSFVSCSASFAVKMHISQMSRSLQHAAYSFDPYIVETFSTLTQGGCVCLARDEARTNPAELVDVIQELGVNWAMMTPSVGRLLPRNEVPSLKTLILCGEALSQTDRFWSNTVRLMNVYGPSECSVVSALNNRVTLDSDCTAIGKGAGSRCWIAEPHNHNLLTPVGCVGELLLDSVGLARGYLGQPGKTAEVFVHGAAWLEEFGRPGNSRMYKTGDLVRYDPADGMISFVGRKDMQLKLHGQRFEPGEVEHHLMAHEQVRIAAVIHPNAGRFKGRLVATLALGFTASTTAESNAILKLVSGPDRAIASLQINDIKMRLEAQVPSYMVPSVWAVVYRVPLTPSAKIGKRDIASWLESMSHETADEIMAFAGAYEEDAGLPSNNEMEQRLRQIVARVLGLDVDQVLVGRSFISLGGDSITAIQAMARCRYENIAVQTKDILQSKSIQRLASVTPEPTLSDFPQMPHLTYQQLDRIKDEIVPALKLSSLADIAAIYPCGPTQKGILISQARSASSYRESFLYAVTSETAKPVDMGRLEAAWKAVVARHDALRTVIIEDTMATDKMRKLSASGTTANTTRKALDPEHSLLLCRTADIVYLYLEISHALIDGFSMPVLLNDIALAYDGLRLGSAGELRPPGFGDYVAHVEGLSADDSFAYWVNYLDGVPSCHFPALKESTIRQMQSIPAELGISSEAIFDFCLEYGLTPASVFRMAWALVLRAYTGMDDVCFGFLASGRDAAVEGIESIIGVVCNMLIVRVNLGNDNSKTGIKMLEAMQDSWSNSLNHQFVSLADVLHRHQQQPSTGPSASSRRPEAILSFDALGGDDGAEYDVTVNVWPAANGSGFRASINYRASHMTAVQARGVSRTFSRAVECIMEMSHRPLAEWCLIREGDAQNSAEQTTALDANTDINPYGSSCVDEVISATAKKSPDGPAVCSWDGQLTYQELETLSTQLAIHLADHHEVGPEVLVPVCVEKSLWFVVAVVAVLKAGAAFVPMDATQPGRFQTVFEQTNARLVLTSEAVRKQLSSNHQVDRTIAPLVVDAELMQRLAPVTSNHAHTQLSNRSRHAAYVIFTSGSTGMPKGVVIEHAAWCSSAAGLIDAIGLDSRARVLQFASYNFDAAVCEILCTLMSGGCLCIPSEAERMDNIEAAINRMKVDTLTVTPSFVATLQPENIRSVHTIVLVGESTPEHQIQRWLGRVRLMLGYGPSECSVMSSIVDCPSVSPLQSNNIGFPRNCKYWIVNPADHNVLAPPGSIGELLIEGTKLSRGYLNDPSRTASAFIMNPLWANRCVGETRKMYKTGDLVRLNADGSYRYTGRKDRQIKISGQRVELGEVEHRAHQALRRKYQVAVEAVDIGGSGSREVRLVAFAAAGDECEDFPLVASGRDSRQTASAFEARHKFRATMMASVPSYMVPSVILPLRQLPYLPSHKIDRNELRRIAFDFFADSSSPRNSSSLPDRVELTNLQQRLRELWASVLNKDAAAISLEDTFLDLGGDSILAIKLVNTCRSAGLAISIANVLRHQSL
ncbi:hypothetical protein BGZ61DRAFT_401297, partial [Ilyonectria robusta]|uniref:uncharacterized protein n=1 Tax=Ilyonectria robusta TaxID=1079257 RepID=UPI001E8E346B